MMRAASFAESPTRHALGESLIRSFTYISFTCIEPPFPDMRERVERVLIGMARPSLEPDAGADNRVSA
jgi:hypothetical protein